MTAQTRRTAPTSAMPPSSDVTEMATVLTSLKFVTRASTAGMEVMSSTAHTPAMCAGLKGKKIIYGWWREKLLNILRFRCLDGSCIGLKERCNQVHDCPHGEDEEQCAGICGGDKWMCRNGDCVPYDQVYILGPRLSNIIASMKGV